MTTIASVKNDSVDLKGEIIESNKISFDRNGNLYVTELVEATDIINRHIMFDGVDDTVDNVGVNNFDWNEGTWEFWIRTRTDFDSLSTNYYESFFGVEQIDPSFRLRVYARGSASLYFTFASRGGDVRFPSKNLTPNEWCHVAITYSATNEEMVAHLNGERISASSFVYSDTQLTTPFRLGQTMGYNSFNGDMREFRVWNKALNQSEIQENMDKTLNGNEAGLVLYLPMNEGEGNVLEDKSGNGNNGLISGATWGEDVLNGNSRFSIGSNGILSVSEFEGIINAKQGSTVGSSVMGTKAQVDNILNSM